MMSKCCVGALRRCTQVVALAAIRLIATSDVAASLGMRSMDRISLLLSLGGAPRENPRDDEAGVAIVMVRLFWRADHDHDRRQRLAE